MPPPRQGQLPAANKIFVDREAPQRIFERTAFEIPDDRSIILVFYGVGGQGKTALCRELIRKTNKDVESSYGFLRRAELDLHGRTKEDPDRLLVWIRNGFADAGVVFPCFDLAFAISWEATRGDEPVPKFTRPWLARTTKLGEAGLDKASSWAADWLKRDDAKELIGDLVGSVPGVGFILKRVGHWAIEKGKRVYLERTKDALKELYRDGEIKKPYELSRLLPWMLAQDLNAHLAANPTERFVLFIDEYERVFDEGGAGSPWKENPFDSHMRDLVAETNGILAVFFSREQLPWGIDPAWRDALRDAQHLLGGLANKDAEAFLRAIPIEGPVIRQAIINGARETSQPHANVYPLLLDLLVEHWRTLTASGAAPLADQFQVTEEGFEGRRQEVVKRVLRDYGVPLESTIERLSVARRFDRQAFTYVVQTFGTGLPLDQFERIENVSFVTRGADEFLTMHNAIAETIRETLTSQKRATSVEGLFRHFGQRAKVATTREVSDETVAALIEAAYLRLGQGVEGYVAWLSEAGDGVRKAARYASVTGLWREAVSISETLLGREHPDTAVSLNNLAVLLKEQGDLAGARPLYERALAIWEKILGPEHSDTATSLDNLAVLLEVQGDLAGARPLLERALAIREEVLGPDHASTATSLNNLGLLLQAQGDLAGARPLLVRALAIREKVLDPEHPDMATSLSNLGLLLQAQGDLAGARPLFESALAIREKLLGPDHPSTATSLNNLASLLRAQGDLAGARPLFESALAISEKVLGPDHPDTATKLNNLASLLRAQGDHAGARPLLERAVGICERVLGPEHFTTAVSQSNLAILIEAQGDLASARLVYERTLAISEKVLGPEHPNTATGLNNLAGLLWTQGDLGSARPLFERGLAIREKALGPEHPDTATSLNNLALLLQAQGDLRGARPLLGRALAIRKKVLGPEHSDTAGSLNTLALLLQAQGDLAGARPLYERAVAISEKVLGPEHPNTATYLNNLALLFQTQGDLAGVRPLLERALVIFEKTLGSDHPITGSVRDNLRNLND
jgi:tetratricopeptide (TPR) repeat protein